MCLTHTPSTRPSLSTGWVPGKGALRGVFQNQSDLRVLREIKGVGGGRGSPAYATLGCPSSQFLSGTAMPICCFGVLGQCLQLTLRSRWSSHSSPPPLSSLPSAPLRARDWAKVNRASQHLLLPGQSPWLSWRPALPSFPQPSCREGGRQLGCESGGGRSSR